jgi:hypothetical protein
VLLLPSLGENALWGSRVPNINLDLEGVEFYKKELWERCDLLTCENPYMPELFY